MIELNEKQADFLNNHFQTDTYEEGQRVDLEDFKISTQLTLEQLED